MIWPRHPQPVTPRKAVAELAVKSTAASKVSTELILVERIAPPGESSQAPASGVSQQPSTANNRKP